MSRWRSTCPDKLLTSIANISEARLYLLRQTGPTGFLLKEHDGETKFKVLLGSVHSCDCNFFLKEKELCKHILWILIRKFRIQKDDPIAFQLGLCERELNHVLYGQKQVENKQPTKAASAGAREMLKQKKIESEDVCPICQDEIYKTKKSLTYCKFGCGNSVHVSCIKIWADHQHKSNNEEVIKCPLCRTEFASYKSILQEHRRSVTRSQMRKNSLLSICVGCKQRAPSTSSTQSVYKCNTCNSFLCQSCFHPNKHYGHQVKTKHGGGEKWEDLGNKEVNLCIGGFSSSMTSSHGKQFSSSPSAPVRPKQKLSRLRSSSQTDVRDLAISGLSLNSEKLDNKPASEQRSSNASTARFRLPPIGKTRGLIGMSGKHRSKSGAGNQTEERKEVDFTLYSSPLNSRTENLR